MIRPGNWIKFVPGKHRAVHASCVRIQRAVVRTAQSNDAVDSELPHGQKSGTMRTYLRVWHAYLTFARDQGYGGRIPGMRCAWDLVLLWKFMQHRARRCKTTTVVSALSALAHMGAMFNHLLATSRYDSDSLMYRKICKMRRQLKIDYALAHNELATAYGPDQCCPLAKGDVSLILSGFSVRSFSYFRKLSRYNRHHVVASVLQHSQGLRFGHFPARMYTWQAFVWSATKREFHLVTDWHRYSGTHRYHLHFPTRTDQLEIRYEVRSVRGKLLATLTPGIVLQWHFSMLRSEREEIVFDPMGKGEPPSRVDRQRWLRDVLLSVLPRSERRARAQVQSVTPHSFRPGLAGDLLSAGVPLSQIMQRCRWLSRRVAKMYAERPSLQALRVSSAFELLGPQSCMPASL